MLKKPTKGYPGSTLQVTSTGLIGPMFSGLAPASGDPLDFNDDIFLDRSSTAPMGPEVPDDFQGMALPIQTGENGQCLLVKGQDQTRKLLRTAFRPCDSENPFFVLGINQDLIFSMNDPHSWNRATLDLLGIAREFQDRLIVREEDITVGPAPDDMESSVAAGFDYVDKETGQRIPELFPLD